MPRTASPDTPLALLAYWRGERTPETRAANAAHCRSTRTAVQRRRMNLLRYGITPEQYDAMLEAQGGVCAACGQPETHVNQYGMVSLAVDHDHVTGRVRGLLCHRCNTAIGLIGEDPERARQLATYLEEVV